MPLDPGWDDLAVRLALGVLAGILIGLNRGEQGRPVGLRTTLLVCLAATVAMMQANLLLRTTGKTADSFITNDLMRLPLGILSGMGFIGAGAILRRDSMVVGVTTAATLWIVTVIGLCFGGGQIGLGIAALALALVTLSCLKWLEAWVPQEHTAQMSLTTENGQRMPDGLTQALAIEGFHAAVQAMEVGPNGQRTWVLAIRWRGAPGDMRLPACIDVLPETAGVIAVKWLPQGMPFA